MQIIVLGMHRSGTSCTTNLIHAAGAYFGEASASITANAQNSKGFWERRDVRQVCDLLLQESGFDWWRIAGFSPDRIGGEARQEGLRRFREVVTEMDAQRPWVMKEPRLCLLLPVLIEALSDPIAVVTLRHPWEVARSLRSRNGMPEAVGLALWERYVRAAVASSSGLPRCLADYDALVQDPKGKSRELIDALVALSGGRLALSGDGVEAVVEAELKRETHEDMPSWARNSDAMALHALLRRDGLEADLGAVEDRQHGILAAFEAMGGLKALDARDAVRAGVRETALPSLQRELDASAKLARDLAAENDALVALGAEAAETKATLQEKIAVLGAEVRGLEAEVKEAERRFSEKSGEASETHDKLAARLARLRADNAAKAEQVRRLGARLAKLQASLSWRLGAPFRRARRGLRIGPSKK